MIEDGIDKYLLRIKGKVSSLSPDEMNQYFRAIEHSLASLSRYKEWPKIIASDEHNTIFLCAEKSQRQDSYTGVYHYGNATVGLKIFRFVEGRKPPMNGRDDLEFTVCSKDRHERIRIIRAIKSDFKHFKQPSKRI